MKKSASEKSKPPSQLIDARIKELGDWRGKMLSRLRNLVKGADPGVVEEWKWRGVPVWYHDGMICSTGKCNCTFCMKARAWKAFVRPAAFRLPGSGDHLTGYHKHPQSSLKYFCRGCGVRNARARQCRLHGRRFCWRVRKHVG